MKPWCAAGLVVAASVVTVSGFAWPLGFGDYAPWPFARAWHMYSTNDGSQYQLKLSGHLSDGTQLELPMHRWFAFEAAPASLRFNEVPREPKALRALASYVCRQFNADASAGLRLEDVTIVDETWPLEAGRRLPSGESSMKRSWTYLDRNPCPGARLE